MLSTKNLLRFKNGFDIRDLHHFASKNVPHTISQILKVTKIQQFRSKQLMLKIDNFKLGQIEKIVSFFKRGALTENNGTITNVQLLMVMERFNIFKKSLMGGGHDEKLKNFGKSKKKSVIFTN